MRQLRDRSPRALRVAKMPYAQVGGYKEQAYGAPPLAQVLLGKLPELKLKFFWRVNPLLHEQSVH
jgi:hypothetical protein